MKVYWDKWDKVYNIGGEIEISSFVEIENLIRRLDQSTYTQIILNGKENYLLVGGGQEQYVVTLVTGTDEDFYTLINCDKKDIEKEITVITGGQAGLFPEKIVVNYASVIEASRYYFEHLDKNPALLWINE